MQEIWKPVVGFEIHYCVSNAGQVKALPRTRRGVSKAGNEFMRRIPEKVLSPAIHTAGYLTIALTKQSGQKARSLLIHRLVADAFIPNPRNLPWINHKDGNKTNNVVSNLEWCTPTENILHALASGFAPVLRGSQRCSAKLNEEKVFAIKKMILLGFTNKKIAELFDVSLAPISHIRNNLAWTHVPW